MAYTFLKAQGYNVGKSLVEEDKLELAKEYLAKAEGKLILPVDHVCADAFAEDANTVVADNDNIPADYMGLDIGPKSIELYKNELAGAKTVVWNGPMGVFEMKPFAKGTLEVCTDVYKRQAIHPVKLLRSLWKPQVALPLQQYCPTSF